jgi:chromosome segregation ATPase
MDPFAIVEPVLTVGGFALAIWQILKTRSAAEAAQRSAQEAAQAIRHMHAVATLQEISGRTRNLLELLRSKKLAAAAAAAFELRDAVSRLPNPANLAGAANLIAWADVALEVDSIHERLESMGVINRWAAEERESLIHRTARLHSKLASGAVQIASIDR